jgi:hypothetical protein
MIIIRFILKLERRTHRRCFSKEKKENLGSGEEPMVLFLG